MNTKLKRQCNSPQAARWSRRDILAGAAGGLASACRLSSRPNILLAVADDQSWLPEKTPVFSRIAREGVQFTNSFCASPSCTPSRSSILSGRHMWQTGEGGLLYGTLSPQYPLFPQMLADAGYHIGFTEKGWGPGDWSAGGLRRAPLGKEYNRRVLERSVSSDVSDGDYAANFSEFLAERPAGAPFFFWFGCREPHRPYERGFGMRSGKQLRDAVLPPFWPEDEIVRGDILDYLAEVDWFDSQSGRLLSKLEEIGELDRTLIVTTSDNGMPFPRAKANLYDWGVRMPLAMRWGSHLERGRTIDDFVSHVDLGPTILEAAGLKPPREMAGRSLLPLLKGAHPAAQDSAFTAMERHTWCRPDGATYPMRAIRTHEFLYVRNFAPERWPTGGPDFVSSNKTFHGDVDEGPTKTFMVERRARFAREYELGFGKRPPEELYDLARDPFQMINVAGEAGYREVKERLWRRLETYLRETTDPRIAGADPWQAYAYRQTVGFGASFNRSLPEAEREKARGRSTHRPE